MFLALALELEAGFARAVGDFLDAAVIDESVAVEDDLVDREREQLLADRLTDEPGLALLLLALEVGLERLVGVVAAPSVVRAGQPLPASGSLATMRARGLVFRKRSHVTDEPLCE